MTAPPGREIFLQEAEELLADMEQTLMDIEERPDDPELLNRIFRDIHTIKGSAAMYGFERVSEFSHHLETVLDHLRNGGIAVTTRLIDLILKCRDHIQTLLQSTEDERTTNAETILGAALRETVAQIAVPADPMIAEAGDSEDKGDDASPTEYRIRFAPSPDIMQTGLDPAAILEELAEIGECGITADPTAVPPLTEIAPDRCYLSWEILLSTRESIETIEGVFIFVADDSLITVTPVKSEHSREKTDTGDSLALREPPTEPPGFGMEAPFFDPTIEPVTGPAPKTETRSGSVRVSADKLDALINLVGELIITQERIHEVVRTLDEFENIKLYKTLSKMIEGSSSLTITPQSLQKALDLTEDRLDTMKLLENLSTGLEPPVKTLKRLAADLRDCALEMRMVPIAALFGKFRRLVRELCADLEKEAILVTEGGETELDKTLMDRIGDPLMHLIRNSMDHGIESPDKREAGGKPRSGVIKLSAVHEESSVLITLEDDGRGIDPEIIRKKAVEDWILSEDEQPNEKTLLNFIFKPQFSTAGEISMVSGRGVGMDVVKREIENLGGAIRLETVKGKFFRIQLSLPLTLAIVNSLLIQVGTTHYTLPMEQVLKCLEMNDGTIKKRTFQNLLSVAGEMIPFIDLRDLFGETKPKTAIPHLVVVGTDEGSLGLVADRIVDDVQSVIKPLDQASHPWKSFSGATVLGDGTLALHIDTKALLKWAMHKKQLAEPRRTPARKFETEE